MPMSTSSVCPPAEAAERALAQAVDGAAPGTGFFLEVPGQWGRFAGAVDLGEVFFFGLLFHFCILLIFFRSMSFLTGTLPDQP